MNSSSWPSLARGGHIDGCGPAWSTVVDGVGALKEWEVNWRDTMREKMGDDEPRGEEVVGLGLGLGIGEEMERRQGRSGEDAFEMEVDGGEQADVVDVGSAFYPQPGMEQPAGRGEGAWDLSASAHDTSELGMDHSRFAAPASSSSSRKGKGKEVEGMGVYAAAHVAPLDPSTGRRTSPPTSTMIKTEELEPAQTGSSTVRREEPSRRHSASQSRPPTTVDFASAPPLASPSGSGSGAIPPLLLPKSPSPSEPRQTTPTSPFPNLPSHGHSPSSHQPPSESVSTGLATSPSLVIPLFRPKPQPSISRKNMKA